MLRWTAAFFLLLSLAGFAAAGAAPPPAAEPGEVPPLLYVALGKVARNFDRWAYTETRMVTDEHGVPKRETVIRVDPSKPYAEQYQPLKIEGKPPTERQLKDYRRRGEKRGERLAREEAAGKIPGSEPPRFGINGSTATVDLAHAVVASENADSVTYEVPLKNDGHGTLPVEKFQLFARVNRQRGVFENVALRVRSAFRVKLVVKVKSGEASVDFATVDARHDPVPVEMTGDATATVLFMKFGGSFDFKRTDFQRVKPYVERFGVQIGPLKALDF
jgi:hypothetical protein